MKRLQVSALSLHVCLDLLCFQNVEYKIYPHTDSVNASYQTWLP